MSTQFTDETGAWVATRWAGARGATRPAYAVDFGTPRNRRVVLDAIARGDTFKDEVGRPLTAAEFAQVVRNAARHTFGEFGGTFALGDGDLARFEGWDG